MNVNYGCILLTEVAHLGLLCHLLSPYQGFEVQVKVHANFAFTVAV